MKSGKETSRNLVRWALIILAFVWMAFVFASFYLVQQQRPLGKANVLAIGSVLLDVIVAGWILLVGVLAGSQVCRWLGLQFDHPSETLVWGSGVGLGVLSLAMLGVGLLGWLTPWAVVGVTVALALFSLPSLSSLGPALASLRSVAAPGRGLRVYLGIMLLLTLLAALTPPLSWDGLFYHLTFPRLYIEQGRIAPVTDVPHQHFPGLMEMLYLAAMLLKGDTAAKLLHFWYLLLLGGGVYLVAQRHLRAGYGWPAVTALASMPMVFVLGGWAYNDLALAYCQVAALFFVLCWLRDRAWRWLALSAVYCGLAMGLKYTSFVCPVTIVLFLGWRLFRERASWGTWARTLLLFGGVALVVAVPWYVRNLAFTGNPVYPFAYGLLGGAGWDEWRAAWYARAGSGLGGDVAELLRLPWTMTLGIRDMNFHDGRIGPLFLLVLPFLLAWLVRLFGRRGARPAAMGYLLAFAAIQFASWVVGVVNSASLFQTRLMLPALAALCPVLGYLFDELRTLDTRALSLRRLVRMSVVLVLAANVSYQLLATHFFPSTLRLRPLAVLVGEESREAFLQRNLGDYYRAMTLVNERVPKDGRVLFLWEPRSYYCLRAAQPDPILERWAWLRHTHGDGGADTIARAIWEDGYTHVLLYRTGLEQVREAARDPHSQVDLRALDAFIADHLVEEASVGTAYELYHLRPHLDQEAQ